MATSARYRFMPWLWAALSVTAPAAKPPAEVLQKYCLSCHSEKVKAAGFTLDPATASHPDEHAGQWEKVVRKLRSNSMPPPGAARPDTATMASLISSLEDALDQAAAAKPNPGRLPLLHRLTRTEYQNAVRDLLMLDSLPKEFDYSLLLPPDNSSSGFRFAGTNGAMPNAIG